MAINKLSQGRVEVGALIVGNGPSAGGAGPSPTTVRKVGSFTATVTPTNPITANSVNVQTVTATGVAVGDAIVPIPPANIEAGLTWSAFVSAANTITLRLNNPGTGTVATAAKSWTFLWLDLTA